MGALFYTCIHAIPYHLNKEVEFHPKHNIRCHVISYLFQPVIARISPVVILHSTSCTHSYPPPYTPSHNPHPPHLTPSQPHTRRRLPHRSRPPDSELYSGWGCSTEHDLWQCGETRSISQWVGPGPPHTTQNHHRGTYAGNLRACTPLWCVYN